MVSPQYEISNVLATEMNRKTTLYTGGRNEVSHQCELLNVSSIVENLQRFLYRWSTQMLCLQYELLLNVSANEIIGKTNLYTGGRYGVSHQCEFLNVSANQMIGKMTLYTGGRYGVSHRCELSCALSDSLN
jgi:hypothetical protein